MAPLTYVLQEQNECNFLSFKLHSFLSSESVKKAAGEANIKPCINEKFRHVKTPFFQGVCVLKISKISFILT
jgi:hypothetical protein